MTTLEKVLHTAKAGTKGGRDNSTSCFASAIKLAAVKRRVELLATKNNIQATLKAETTRAGVSQ